MVYHLSYYNETVEAELDSWPVGLRARFRALSVRMEEYGPNLGCLIHAHLAVAFLQFAPRQKQESGEYFSALWSVERL